MERKKPLICKKCKLYNSKEQICSVVIVQDNEKYELKTNPNDECFWEKNGVEVHEIAIWSNGKDGFIKSTDPNLDIHPCE
jgi:uncharacterized protein YkuJ